MQSTHLTSTGGSYNSKMTDVVLQERAIYSERQTRTRKRKSSSRGITDFEEKILGAVSSQIRQYCLLVNSYPSVADRVTTFHKIWNAEIDKRYDDGTIGDNDIDSEGPSRQWLSAYSGLYSLERYDKSALASNIRRLREEDRFLEAAQYRDRDPPVCYFLSAELFKFLFRGFLAGERQIGRRTADILERVDGPFFAVGGAMLYRGLSCWADGTLSHDLNSGKYQEYMDTWNHFLDSQRKVIKENFKKFCKLHASDLFEQPTTERRDQKQFAQDYMSFKLDSAE
ncbi:Protein of unknown function [Pyronema omphalodes CBS 100304]|uniref:Uncharacterized protein n=1 Tax=Pyronema omphalodes (strain CBS 100304) TaxID=1076935 RepID=U4L760_PYROM|nr:Protein of unknown function [Pyronema omphalodes CBS 100304]